MESKDRFELKATDLAGRIGLLETKTSKVETPALLPVIHPVKQILPCDEIRSMGFEAVMTNAYTTFRRLNDRASEGIHKIIGFDGTVMTDSGGYQVLEFGSVDIDPLAIADFEEKIGSDIAVILDRPTGLNVTRSFARKTVTDTLASARRTLSHISRDDVIWTLPVQGGSYLDLVSKSAKESSGLDYGCYALGSPTEVMEGYDFPLLVKMIVAAKTRLPANRPFHLFGAGHPLILPLAVAMGCDMFDSASYMLYAKQDRYISPSGTIRLDNLEYLPCVCSVCSSMTARELRGSKREERVLLLARHNLLILKEVMEETKQAIWEGRLWEYARAKCSNHPLAFEAFKTAFNESKSLAKLADYGTPGFKERGIFVQDSMDLGRPEMQRHSERLRRAIELKRKTRLVIVPETISKPFLTSDLFREISILVDPYATLVCYASTVFGLVPAELSDIFPVSQLTEILESFPESDGILNGKVWPRVDVLLIDGNKTSAWVASQIDAYRAKKLRIKETEKRIVVSSNYKTFKKKLAEYSGVNRL